MKTIIATVSVFAVSLGAFAQFATPGTAINAGTNYAVIPATGGTPLLTYLNMNALAASGTVTLTSYVSTNNTIMKGVNSTTTLNVNSTNGFTAGQWVVIEHGAVSNPRLRNEAAIISSVNANGTNIVLATAPVTACAAGDNVRAQIANATIPLASSATAREINGAGIISGDKNRPLLLTLVGSAASTNTINAASVSYVP